MSVEMVPRAEACQVLTVKCSQPLHVLRLVLSALLWTYSERTRNLLPIAFVRPSFAAARLLESRV
jgi:hypothetical protein